MPAKNSKKIHDETNVLSRKKGNGVLRREVWVDEKGKVTRYNLAYINAKEFAEDNGRIVGYDNAHDYHHRHYYGKVHKVKFVNFQQIEESFEIDVTEILNRLRNAK